MTSAPFCLYHLQITSWQYMHKWRSFRSLSHHVVRWVFSMMFHDKLDVDPQRDDDASPMSTYRCMLRPTWMISALQHKSKYKSNSISNFFEKKNQIFWFPCCSTREDLSVDVSTINYSCRTDIDEARAFFFSRRTETWGTDRIQFCQFWTFKKFFTFLGFHGVILVKIIPLMYQLLM